MRAEMKEMEMGWWEKKKIQMTAFAGNADWGFL